MDHVPRSRQVPVERLPKLVVRGSSALASARLLSSPRQARPGDLLTKPSTFQPGHGYRL